MVPVNRDEWYLIQADDRDAVREHTLPYYNALLADPVAGLRDILEDSPSADQAVMADPAWQASIARGLREALDGNLEGWIDESFALETRWDQVDLSAITTSITWYHGHSDIAAPLSAAARLVARIPSARLVEIADAGHLATYHLEGQILDELLSRSR